MPHKKEMESFVRCLCPKCRREHTATLFWTGRSPLPRIFCQQCRDDIARSGYGQVEPHGGWRVRSMMIRGGSAGV